jgi:integrase/recombinase XerD
LHQLQDHSNSNNLPVTFQATSVIPRQADTDDQLIELWLHGRPKNTQVAYRLDIGQFLDAITKSLQTVTLGDLQSYADQLDGIGLQPTSINRKIATVKSLFSFGHRLGYFPFDVARPVRMQPVRNKLTERILSEAEVKRMIALEPDPRNQLLLLLLYASAIRVSEASSLKWSDVQERDEGCQITVMGKGGKTRTILLPASVANIFLARKKLAAENEPVIKSKKGGHLHPSQMMRIVRAAAKRAGINRNVSPHWLRHCHASHALDRGCPIHQVQATCGHSSVAVTSTYLHARPTEGSSKFLDL